MIHAHLGQDAGHRKRVLYVRLAGETGLALMGRRREIAGTANVHDLGIVEIAREKLTKLAD
jgi:hypothetical protein